MFWKKRGHKISVQFPELVNLVGNWERVMIVVCLDCDEWFRGNGHREFREWLRNHGVKVKRK